MCAITALVLTENVQVVHVGGSSMEPTLCDGAVLLVVGASGTKAPRTDDLVILEHPGRPSETLVKRVVATAGQEVVISDGVLIRNGLAVPEPWVDYSTIPGLYSARSTVPADSVYVLGDRRETSIDSRDFGPIPLRLVRSQEITIVTDSC